MTYLPYLTLNIITEFYLHRNIHCRREDCGCCNQLKGSQKVISYQTKFTVEIPCILACYSTCVIYLLECKHCFKQYVGETNSSLRSRMKRHRNMSTQATRRPLYSHLQIHQKPFAATYSLSIIEQIKDTTQRRTRGLVYSTVQDENTFWLQCN